MKLKTKPAVFAADKVTVDMLMLVWQALLVGTGAAVLAALVVASFVTLLA